MTRGAIAYQDYVSGKPGTDFHVITPQTGKVKFDGCRDEPAGPKLLEAKADHGGLLDGKNWSQAEKSVPKQGKSQDDAAKALGVPNKWHTQTLNDRDVIREIFKDLKLKTPVIHDPINSSDK